MLLATTLDERITDYSTLVALVLVLVTLFTTQRANRLAEIDKDTNRKKAEATQEVWLNGAMVLVTTLLFASGLPLVLDSIKSFHATGNSGPLRGGFTITWLLVAVLIIWQATLWCRARQLRSLIRE